MRMVLLTALGVGGATVVGALIGFVFKKASHRFSDIILSFAAGVMLAIQSADRTPAVMNFSAGEQVALESMRRAGVKTIFTSRKFVDKLKEYGATATFFVVGERMSKAHGEALQYAIDNGCEVGLHSYEHEYYNKMTMDEYLADLSKTEAAIKKYVDVDIRLMRPPGGIISTAQREACPYTVVKWSVDSNDWRYVGRSTEEKRVQNVNTIVNNVMKNIRHGDIVLMHELYTNSYEAFCIIIEQLYAQGFQIVTVGELLGEARIVPGILYSNGR